MTDVGCHARPDRRASRSTRLRPRRVAPRGAPRAAARAAGAARGPRGGRGAASWAVVLVSSSHLTNDKYRVVYTASVTDR